MHLPTINGLIDRRILINYRVDPAVLARFVPAPLRPLEVAGYGIAGICLIRLKHLRPWPLPGWLGLGSENAAHRIAVEWEEAGRARTGVYIPRRDTSSRLNSLAGGRVFPGLHHHARFDVTEKDDHYRLQIDSDDGQVQIAVRGRVTEALPRDSVFAGLAAAAGFFDCGSLGFSPTRRPNRLECLELKTLNCNLVPLGIEHVRSSFFENSAQFPPGSCELDSALLMRGIRHRWHTRGFMECCGDRASRLLRFAENSRKPAQGLRD